MEPKIAIPMIQKSVGKRSSDGGQPIQGCNLQCTVMKLKWGVFEMKAGFKEAI
jgi:hypothetical protein